MGEGQEAGMMGEGQEACIMGEEAGGMHDGRGGRGHARWERRQEACMMGAGQRAGMTGGEAAAQAESARGGEGFSKGNTKP